MMVSGSLVLLANRLRRTIARNEPMVTDANPKQTVKETAFQLGFPTTANFCRYFKRATGIYPQAYKKGTSD